jgi:CubicO group peptidase (beta-lactamase class C family)
MRIDEAFAYAAKHQLHALLVQTGTSIALEEYANGHTAEKPHPLYSGTKSFWGIAALEAAADGIIDLDATVDKELPEFAHDARRKITPRMLLQLLAGYGFGGLGSAVPTYDRALEIPLKNPPGTTFTYGGIQLQVFGAYFARALSSRKLTPHDYLRAKVLDPAGVGIASWRDLKDGTQPLPTGAMLTARAWLTYGRCVLERRQKYADALRGSATNPRYGLCWWLAPAGTPADCFYASGAAGQALYVIPSHDTVVVRFGKSTSYKHEVLLKRLLSKE